MDHHSAVETPTDLNNGFVGADPVERHVGKSEGSDSRTADHQEDHGTEETERQRIERLGRERPAKLNSLGAEVFFCYSVIASQFMAVSQSTIEDRRC